MKPIYFILIILTMFILINCRPIVQNGKYFSYPKDTSPFENNWQFWMFVGTDSQRGGIFEKAKRSVKILVRDKNDNILLKEKYKVEYTFLKTVPIFDADWDDYKTLTIKISERGNPNPNVKNEYNDFLLKNGPKLLLKLQYEFNEDSNKYLRVE